MNKRRPYFDFLRGFAIIMVVGIHTGPSNLLEFKSLEEGCAIVMRLMLNCAVPLFLAISGYFMAGKHISTSKDHLKFLYRQVPKVYIPCLIFSLPYLILSVLSSESNILKSLAVFFACGFSIYYFIALIIQYYLLIPLLNKVNKWGGVILTASLSAISIVAVTYIMKVMGVNLPLLIYAGPFPLWILFFFMGMYFGTHSRNYSLLWPATVTVIGLALQIAEYIFWQNRGIPALGIKLSSFIFSAGVIWLCFADKVESRYRENVLFSAINWIGGISFGVYLLHCYWIEIIRHFMPSLNWAMFWILVLSVTVLTIWAIKSIMPDFAKKYLGFR